MHTFNKFGIAVLSALVLAGTGCKDKDEDPATPDNQLNVPSTYNFERNGATSVSYSGQTDRLNQLGEIKSAVGQG